MEYLDGEELTATLLVTFNVLFRVNEAGLRTKATPLVGMEDGF